MNQLLLHFIKRFGCVLILCLAISACSDQDEKIAPAPTDPEEQHLVDAQLLHSFDKEEVLLLTSLSDYQGDEQWIQYGIDIYKITYLTTYQDQSVEASGLLCIPKNLQTKAPFLAGLHGTIIDKHKAPSNFGNTSTLSGFEIFASLGFITAIPDYLGFGESEEIFHPYYDAYHTGKTTTDMLLAAQEFVSKEEIPSAERLFITGYSEGGYAAVATLKYIEENKIAFKVEATAAGAGGYNIKKMVESIIDQGAYTSPAYLVYVIYAYNIRNEWNRPLSDYFQEPYASQIPAYVDGSLSIGQINNKLPKEFNKLFNSTFLQRIRDNTETAFITALEENSVHYWSPQSPLRLYHEKDDEIVPFSNSEETYDTMLSLGAQHTAFFPYDDATSHATGARYMYEMAIPWFISLRD